MTLEIRPANPRDADVRAILQQSHDLMRQLFNPEDNHFLSIDELCAPNIRFFGAYERMTLLGTGAMAICDGYGELKSMFTDPAARGRGVAGAIIDHIEHTARAEGLPLLRLETGDLLTDAHRLYAAKGFTLCGAFGDYPLDGEHSVFMEKALTA